MRIPSFSRQSGTDTADDERPTVATGNTTPVRERVDTSVTQPSDATTTRWSAPPAPPATDRNIKERHAARAVAASDTTADLRPVTDKDLADRDRDRADQDRTDRDRTDRDRTPVVAGPKPRASLLATLGLILAVASVLLVLSGPLLGYGIGVAVLALILSLSGIHATGRRHVAGKSDALIGMVLSLGAIVVGVLALTGSLSWLGTDTQPVNSVREWLDTQFVDRF